MESHSTNEEVARLRWRMDNLSGQNHTLAGYVDRANATIARLQQGLADFQRIAQQDAKLQDERYLRLVQALKDKGALDQDWDRIPFEDVEMGNDDSGIYPKEQP